MTFKLSASEYRRLLLVPSISPYHRSTLQQYETIIYTSTGRRTTVSCEKSFNAFYSFFPFLCFLFFLFRFVSFRTCIAPTFAVFKMRRVFFQLATRKRTGKYHRDRNFTTNVTRSREVRSRFARFAFLAAFARSIAIKFTRMLF